ncbi:hypothetical protein HY745_00020 [Candidatus Desantisbacteria bacterium]|nr:hypothetical protein [Candidatus Desantisbacteria bacterium]
MIFYENPCLRDREESKELLGMQMTSKAYLDWLSPENDIYDAVNASAQFPLSS